ncbi:MAG: hypothetical protein KGZ39_00710 [Simkania sp.]|nr:hypothetical protein [Simkania sp.]
MRSILRTALTYIALVASCHALDTNTSACASSNIIQAEQHFIFDPLNQVDNRIEFFTMKPSGEGPFPVMFLLHGHQAEPSKGGKELIDFHWGDPFVKEGIATVSISIPGFGHSDGPRDYSGPNTKRNK